ncbi:shikimate dehydrogenase [Salipaludibacillus keqinensis]|uniref:Shikimate dehydrogenase (NADP(+)) n=1 Tax=Salipaludibacillus keqinensis TaxID=2045207 RepID=A0A323THA8_9BACI|nr:shikimate dehydrogenase [Salipaludibacillus keqinensis]PYZ94218.1 shikimate dehydrogenase [Salipaludibacillus keqinensis]
MKQVYGVIGHPISHSLSPLMHQAAFNELNIDASYLAFDVHENRLKEAMDGVRGLGISGLNVTIPHKVNVMEYLDNIDPLAQRIGAVNTVVNRDGKLTGYNTDGEGYIQALLPVLPKTLNKMRVLILGAGGAAKGVAMTLGMTGAKELYIANRTIQRAEQLAEECSSLTNAAAISIQLAQARLTEFDLIVNTTSIGMTPHVDQMPLSLEMIARGVVVSDLIYTPSKTRWLREAERKGATIQNGLGMFINQGALAFEKWTGQDAPRELMKKTVVENLGG